MACDSSYGLWPTERRRPSLALLSHFESCIATALDQRAVELEIENIVHMIELDDRVLLTLMPTDPPIFDTVLRRTTVGWLSVPGPGSSVNDPPPNRAFLPT